MSTSTNSKIGAFTTPAHRPRFQAALLVALGSLVAATLPAHAAPPANDSISTPVSVGALPWTHTQDTRQATSSPTDGRCVAGSSVWYRYRPSTTARRKIVTIGSDYDTVLTLFRGPRNSRTFITCNDDGADFFNSALAYRFEAGRTYWIAVSACCRPSARGGNSVLTIYRGALSLSFSVDSVSSGEVSGRAIVSGSATCTVPAHIYPSVTLSQRVGEHVARGSSGVDEEVRAPLVCSANGTAWSAAVDSETGWAFQPGQAIVTTAVGASDGFTWIQQTTGPTEMTLTSAPNARLAR